ncbi:hypothetical protein [Microcoleus sp. B3-A4]
MEELEDEPRWELAHACYPDALAQLAAPRAEYHAGKTQELAPETW